MIHPPSVLCGMYTTKTQFSPIYTFPTIHLVQREIEDNAYERKVLGTKKIYRYFGNVKMANKMKNTDETDCLYVKDRGRSLNELYFISIFRVFAQYSISGITTFESYISIERKTRAFRW